MLKLSALILAISACALSFAGSGHWSFVTASRNTLIPPTTTDGVTLGSTRLGSFAIPSDPTLTYGSGTFRAIGSSISVSKVQGWNPSTQPTQMQTYMGEGKVFYQMTYQWFADSPGDVPPAAPFPCDAFGYSLESCSLTQEIFTPPVGKWDINWQALFNLQGPTLSVSTGGSGPFTWNWPAPGQKFQVSGLYIRPSYIAGGNTSVDANGVVTWSCSYAQDDMIAILNSNFTGHSISFGIQNYGTLTHWLAPSWIGGIPVK